MSEVAFYGSVAASACAALVQCWKLILISGSDWGDGGSGMVNLGLVGLGMRLYQQLNPFAPSMGDAGCGILSPAVSLP
jgi:hypothetical protein